MDAALLAELQAELLRRHDALTARIEQLEMISRERQPGPLLPHVVMGPGDVLVLTGPDDMTPGQFQALRANVAAMNLHGRVVVISPALRAVVEPAGDSGIEPPLLARPDGTCPVCGTSTEYHHPSDHEAERTAARDQW